MPMEQLGEILLSALHRTNLERKLQETKIFLDYEMMVGEKIAEISKPTFMQNGILFIGVKNHIWLHELYMLKLELINKINSHLPNPLVKDIKFQISDIKDMKKPKSDVKLQDVVHIEIPEKTMKLIYNICRDIHDEDLRKKFMELMIKDAKFKMKRGKILVHTHRQ